MYNCIDYMPCSNINSKLAQEALKNERFTKNNYYTNYTVQHAIVYSLFRQYYVPSVIRTSGVGCLNLYSTTSTSIKLPSGRGCSSDSLSVGNITHTEKGILIDSGDHKISNCFGMLCMLD